MTSARVKNAPHNPMLLLAATVSKHTPAPIPARVPRAQDVQHIEEIVVQRPRVHRHIYAVSESVPRSIENDDGRRSFLPTLLYLRHAALEGAERHAWSAPHPPSQFPERRSTNVDGDLHPFDSVLLVQHLGMAADE